MKKGDLLYGVGINDADYPITRTENYRQVWICPFYATWRGVLCRCYDMNVHKKRPKYAGCSVWSEWLTFSNFRQWMSLQDWEGKQLDKDLLVKGNKVYSPETCLFVPANINGFILGRNSLRGVNPIGVDIDKRRSKNGKRFRSRVSNNRGEIIGLGYYYTPEEAHQSWQKGKIVVGRDILRTQTNPKIITALKRVIEGLERDLSMGLETIEL